MNNQRIVKCLYIFTWLLTVAVSTVSAQHFQWQAALPVTPDSGFYKIPLTTDLIAKSHGTDLRDIRIYDQGNVVSYILNKEAGHEWLPVPAISRVKDAPAGYSVLQLQFREACLLKGLKFEVATPGYYFRQAYITTDWASDLHTNFESRENKFRFSSDSINSITLRQSIKGTTFFLVVLDEDNQPLDITSTIAWQDTYYLTAWLEKGKHYVLKTGDPELTAPRYDLPHFAGKVPASIPTLVAGNITADPAVIPAQPTPATTDQPTWFRNKGWIWISIIGITILILLLTIRLLKDMQEKR